MACADAGATPSTKVVATTMSTHAPNARRAADGNRHARRTGRSSGWPDQPHHEQSCQRQEVERFGRGNVVRPSATSRNEETTRHVASAATNGNIPEIPRRSPRREEEPDRERRTSNDPMWRALCTGSPASDPRTSAGRATTSCTSAIAASMTRRGRMSDNGRRIEAALDPIATSTASPRSGTSGAGGAPPAGAAARLLPRRRGSLRTSRGGRGAAVVETGILAVETGGERIAKPDARHGPVVDSKPEMVPPVSSVAVDELTRLFLAARDGDRAALLAAIRTSQADVWRLAAHLVDPSEADDVTQDTFVRAWQALPAFRGDASAADLAVGDRPPGLRGCRPPPQPQPPPRRTAARGGTQRRPPRRARARRPADPVGPVRAGRAARWEPTQRVRADPDRRLLVLRSGRGVRRTGRDDPLARRPAVERLLAQLRAAETA